MYIDWCIVYTPDIFIFNLLQDNDPFNEDKTF